VLHGSVLPPYLSFSGAQPRTMTSVSIRPTVDCPSPIAPPTEERASPTLSPVLEKTDILLRLEDDELVRRCRTGSTGEATRRAVEKLPRRSVSDSLRA
jgi:hypothetical protein